MHVLKASAGNLRCVPLFTRAIGAAWYGAFPMRCFTSTLKQRSPYTLCFRPLATQINGVRDFRDRDSWPPRSSPILSAGKVRSSDHAGDKQLYSWHDSRLQLMDALRLMTLMPAKRL